MPMNLTQSLSITLLRRTGQVDFSKRRLTLLVRNLPKSRAISLKRFMQRDDLLMRTLDGLTNILMHSKTYVSMMLRCAKELMRC